MIQRILKTRSLYWQILFEGDDIFLINDAKEKIQISIAQLAILMKDNIFNKLHIGTALFLVERNNNVLDFIRRDSQEYKDYLELKEFNKNLLPGNIFLGLIEGNLQEYKFISNVFFQRIIPYRNINSNYYVNLEKYLICLNLSTNSFVMLQPKNIIDILEFSEEIFSFEQLKSTLISFYPTKNYFFWEERFIQDKETFFKDNILNYFNFISFDKKVSDSKINSFLQI